MKRAGTYALGLFTMLGFSAFGQGIIGFSGGGGMSRDGHFQGNATFHLPLPIGRLKTAAPYSGEEQNESVQTLPNGTHITHQVRGLAQKTWRDSQGRVRMERQLGANSSRSGFPTIVQIADPVSGYAYIMDDINKVAHRVQLTPQQRTAAPVPPQRVLTGVIGPVGTLGSTAGAGAGGIRSGVAQSGQERPRPQMSTESLGTKLIDGVSVQGTRRTTVIPAGLRDNDGPITTSAESWYSPELDLTVLTVSVGESGATSTRKIANLSTAEPDPALFMVPPDYKIVDETGSSFTIKWGEQEN